MTTAPAPVSTDAEETRWAKLPTLDRAYVIRVLRSESCFSISTGKRNAIRAAIQLLESTPAAHADNSKDQKGK